MLQAAPFLHVACLAASLAATGCATEPQVREGAPEWHRVETSVGAVDVMLIPPSTSEPGPHPVVFALPWGSGTPQLVQTFVSSYWLTEPAARGYYVVSPAVRGSSLEQTAGDVIPSLFGWMEDEIDFDASSVALVGASNGGRGIFHAALDQPQLFAALMGLPGSYSGDPQALDVLTGKPIRLLVGEFDDPWVDGTEATAAALATHGITAEVEIVPGEGHVMALDPQTLLDWIDQALGR